MDDNVIKQALDSFENDDFIDAKEKLKGEIARAKNDFLKTKLGLTKDIVELPSKEDVTPPERKRFEIKRKVSRKNSLTGK